MSLKLCRTQHKCHVQPELRGSDCTCHMLQFDWTEAATLFVLSVDGIFAVCWNRSLCLFGLKNSWPSLQKELQKTWWLEGLIILRRWLAYFGINLNQIWVHKTGLYRFVYRPWAMAFRITQIWNSSMEAWGSNLRGTRLGITWHTTTPTSCPRVAHLASLRNALEACPTIRHVEIIPGGHILRSSPRHCVTALPQSLRCHGVHINPYHIEGDLLVQYPLARNQFSQDELLRIFSFVHEAFPCFSSQDSSVWAGENISPRRFSAITCGKTRFSLASTQAQGMVRSCISLSSRTS